MQGVYGKGRDFMSKGKQGKYRGRKRGCPAKERRRHDDEVRPCIAAAIHKTSSELHKSTGLRYIYIPEPDAFALLVS